MSVEKRFSISLDVKQPTSNRDIEVVEGDTGNILVVTLTDNGQAVDLTDCKVCAVFAKPNGQTAMQDTDGNGLTVAGEDMNEITIELYNTSFSPGMVTCEIQVFSGESMGTLITSAQFNFKCRRGIANEDTIQSTDEWPMLVGMLQQVAEASREVEGLNVLTAEAADTANAAAAEAESMAALAEEATATAQAAEAERQAAEQSRVNAEAARMEAEAAREAYLRGITAEAMALPVGAEPTAEWNASTGLPVLKLGLPLPKNGKDAVNVSLDGMFYLRVDDDGNLFVVVPDNVEQPPFRLEENGDLYYVIE